MSKILLIIALITQALYSQTIKGSFSQAQNTKIVLNGFDNFSEKELSKTTTDILGKFTITYPNNYSGAAILQIQNATSIIILLNQENFEVQWSNLQDFNTLKFINSEENNNFLKGIVINKEAESKLEGLNFLLPQYQNSYEKQQLFINEINFQKQQCGNFLNQLPKNSYAKYYLKIRKLITDFPLTANRYIERMPQHEIDFNNLDFNEPKLKTSGLLKDLLEGYFQFLESHLKSDEMYRHIYMSTNVLLNSLAINNALQQDVAQFVFTHFEKRSLFPAAEHLAMMMLNNSNCQLSEKSSNLFEQYRKLAIGNTAPNINFNQANLKELNSKYKFLIFGASWCPNCQTDYPKLKEKYKYLKETFNLEMIYISLDIDSVAYTKYYKDAPFITFCDFKGWETIAAKDYYVFATPTYILLDKELKILAKINSPEHLESWLLSQKKNSN